MLVDRLKGCPHCNGAAALTSNYSYKRRCYFVYVRCDICGAQGKIYSSDNDPDAVGWNDDACQRAADAWNMRTTDTDSKPKRREESDE